MLKYKVNNEKERYIINTNNLKTQQNNVQHTCILSFLKTSPVKQSNILSVSASAAGYFSLYREKSDCVLRIICFLTPVRNLQVKHTKAD